MNVNNLVYGAPVVLYKSEGIKPLKHNKTAEEFQNSIQRVKPKTRVIAKSKACKGCHEVKDLSEFRKNATTRDGKRGKCRICENKREMKRYNKKKGKA